MSFSDAPGMASMRFTSVPEDQRQEYSTVFDNLWRFVIEVDPKMTMYAVLLQEDLVRRLIAMVRLSDVFWSCPFLTCDTGFNLSTTTIVALIEPPEIPLGTPSSEDDDWPGPRMYSYVQPSVG